MKDHSPSSLLQIWESQKNTLQTNITNWQRIAAISSPMVVRGIEDTLEMVRMQTLASRRNIYNSTIIDAQSIWTAGFQAGICPSDNPWFVNGISMNGRLLTLNDVDPSIKQLIDYRTDVTRTTIYESNFYDMIPELFADGGMFGNGGFLMDESEKLDGSLEFEYVPLGTFVCIDNHMGKPQYFQRRLLYTTAQMVSKFARRKDGTYDWSKVSTHVQQLWNSNQLMREHIVFHVICPNDEYSAAKPFKSYYFQQNDHRDKYLREGTYSYFPFYFFRWSKRQGEVFSPNGPGINIFNDNEYIQILEKGTMMGYKQKADPTLKVTPDVDLSKYNRTKSGGAVVVPDVRDSAMVEPLFAKIMYPFTEVENKVDKIEQRVRNGFFNQMFLAFLSPGNRTEKTREEIMKKFEEKLAMLGPVVGRVKNDVLSPFLMDATMIMERAGRIPTVQDIQAAMEQVAGRELGDQRIQISPIFTSYLFQAMRTMGLDNFNNFLGTVGALAQSAQGEGSLESPWDWVNRDKVTLGLAEKYTISAELLHSKAEVDKIREGRANQAQEAQQAQQAETANIQASTVETLVRSGGTQGGAI